jgi:internalin A
MGDDHSINIGGDVINSQVGQTLTNCTNMIQQQVPGEKKDLLDLLRQEVEVLIKRLPENKKAEAPKLAKKLETVIDQATSEEPERPWYDLSAKGLLEAADWVKDFSGKIGGTLLNLGKLAWPGYSLPKPD